jgi:phosphoglycolate phosphatase
MSAAGACYRAVLFDLDGTLLDTAPDMAGALNALRLEESLPPLDYAPVRAQVSHGSVAVVRLGFPGAEAAEFERLRQRFLTIYATRLTRETRLFPGFDSVLVALERGGIQWGIVTNKPGFLTELPSWAGLLQRGLRSRGTACRAHAPDTAARGRNAPACPADCIRAMRARHQAARAAGMLADRALRLPGPG